MLRADAFDQVMFRRRIQQRLFGAVAWIATPEDIILHKLYCNRITPSDRQLGDVAGIVVVQKNALQEHYLQQWAAKLRVQTALEDALAGRLRPKST